MSKQVVMWETENGERYATKEEADHKEQKNELKGYIDRYPIYGNSDGCTVYGEGFETWLDDNPRIFVQLLPEEHNDDRS